MSNKYFIVFELKSATITVMFKFLEVKNKSEFNPLLITKNAPFTQAWFFGEWQEMMGRKVRRFEILDNSEILGFFQIIKYPLPFEQSFLYIPHAPLLRQDYEGQAEFLKEFREKLIEIGKEENAIFIRFDFYFHNWNYGSKNELDRYFIKTPIFHYYSSYFQPKFEWILDLTKSEEEILSDMHSKTRYNIGLAERRGVKVEIISQNFDKYFADFYKLLEETAERDNFNLHPKNYYENIFNILDSDSAFLAIAKYNGKILAINLILIFGNMAYFTHGGSSGEHKNLMASHLAHWKAIKETKNRGFKFYNFGAVGERFLGISRFKKSFGGELLEYSDSYDLILKPFWYWLYSLRKKLQSHR